MSIEIELEQTEYEPGSELRGSVVLTPLAGQEDHKVELSVLWQTEGKGDTDFLVERFRVLTEGGDAAAQGTHAFEVRLPLLPLTYSGTLLKIRWLVRVRRYATLGDDLIEEKDFVVRWPA
jgi:hypothetical protein